MLLPVDAAPGMERLRHTTMQEYYRRCRWVLLARQATAAGLHGTSSQCEPVLLFSAPHREAEQYRDGEQQSAVVLQACWRGRLQRQEIDNLR